MLAHSNGVNWITSQDKISNLSLDETKCKCGRCESNSMQQRIIDLFQMLRDKIGKPITITSAMRCAEQNVRVGGKKNSQHLSGLALDMKPPTGYDVESFAKELESVGFDGIGRYYKQKFVHGDGRGSKVRWNDSLT